MTDTLNIYQSSVHAPLRVQTQPADQRRPIETTPGRIINRHSPMSNVHRNTVKHQLICQHSINTKQKKLSVQRLFWPI